MTPARAVAVWVSSTGPDPALLGTVGLGCASVLVCSTKHWPHQADPTCEGPAPSSAPSGKRLPGQPSARGGCSRPRCADEGILARDVSRKSFQDLLGRCQLAGSCLARAGQGTGATHSPHSPGQGDPRAALGWGGSFCTPDPWLGPIAALLEAVWTGRDGDRDGDRGPRLCRLQVLVGTVMGHTPSGVRLWGTVCRVQFVGYSHSISPRGWKYWKSWKSWKSWKFLPPAGK